ncbi:LCP family protein [Streptomyces sp. CA-106131]|uniref:LCP family protein n=1 Tax=Streptomyces sp. CA-106131 TaxID=3240045 RepID=UPI003D9271B3
MPISHQEPRRGRSLRLAAPAHSRPGTSRRAMGGRRRRMRLLMVSGISLLVLGTAGFGRTLLMSAGEIDTFDADGISGNRPGSGGKGENVLVIGSDGRVDGNSELSGGDKADVGRADTAFLLHVYSDHRHAVVVSIPRDTLVTIPPCRLPDGTWSAARTNTMFNAAYSVGQTVGGNPACAQNTVEKLTGLRVDHTVVVDFKGFAKLTEAVGGVRVCLPQDIYQKDLSPHRAARGRLLFHKGPQTVSGLEALDYVRIRHGMGDGSDIGRIKRQHAFMASLIKKVKGDGLTPARLLPLAEAATTAMTVDPGLGTANKLVSFAMTLKEVDLHNIKFVTVPWRYQGSRVAVVHPDADKLWAALKTDRAIGGADAGRVMESQRADAVAASPSPSVEMTVSGRPAAVAVYNGTRINGLTSRAAQALMRHGFTVSRTGNASSRGHAITLVQYSAVLKSEAEKIAKLFPGAQLQPIAGPGVTLILGQHVAPSTVPASRAPTSAATSARSADDDLCSDLSYGRDSAAGRASAGRAGTARRTTLEERY